MNVLRVSPQGVEPAGDRLAPIVEGLNRQRAWLANVPLSALLALWDDFSARLLRDPRTKPLEGRHVPFRLAAAGEFAEDCCN